MPKTLTPEALAGRLFVTTEEAAVALQWEVRTVRRQIASGDIPATKAGNTYRIPAVWVRERAQLDGSPGALEALQARVADLEVFAARLRAAL